MDDLTGPEAEQFEEVKKFLENNQGELVGALIAAGVDGVEVQNLLGEEELRYPNLEATLGRDPGAGSEWVAVPLAPPPVHSRNQIRGTHEHEE